LVNLATWLYNKERNKKMKAKFKKGEKVDFVNDYGVIFTDFEITDVELTEDGYKYQVIPNDTPWFWKYEKNLHHAGTYKKENLDIKLNNNSIAQFLNYDDWGNIVFNITNGEYSFNAVMLNNLLYSISDYDEPIEPLKKEYQPLSVEKIQFQSTEVQNYFNVFKNEDPLLNIESFFEKVVSSLKKNGTEKTSKCYDLDITILHQIKF
jgi:hypothetical protein